MIEEIQIRNLGVIESAGLHFTNGLTCITGETGAGKTMVLTALNLLLGRRSDSGLVRHGSPATSVEGIWLLSDTSAALPIVDEAGGVVEDGQLFLNRTVTSDGKSKAVVGGKTSPVATLVSIGEHLVAIHGQSDQIRLKSPTAQRTALDKYAGEKLVLPLASYMELYNRWRHLKKEIDDIKNNMQARQREFEDLHLFVKDYEKVNPERNEDETLRIETEKLANLEALQDAAASAMQMLSSDDYDVKDLTTLASEVARALSSMSDADPEMSSLADAAENLKVSADELSSSVSAYLSNIDLDALNNLNQMHERRSMIGSLIRKYGPTLDDVINAYEGAATRMAELDPESSNVEALETELGNVYKQLVEAADKLYKIRSTAADELCSKVTEELQGLAMGGSSLIIEVKRTDEYLSYGADEITFLLKHNGGGVAKPIGQAMSGGEASRIFLAIELVLADPSSTPTFVFDEVDSGVGGSTAIEVGKRLASLSKTAQVIVVTHLPQVAAFADNHLRVLKSSGDNFISTDVKQLSRDERLTEIARMLSGLDKSDTGTAHAQELLDFADNFKQA